MSEIKALLGDSPVVTQASSTTESTTNQSSASESETFADKIAAAIKSVTSNDTAKADAAEVTSTDTQNNPIRDWNVAFSFFIHMHKTAGNTGTESPAASSANEGTIIRALQISENSQSKNTQWLPLNCSQSATRNQTDTTSDLEGYLAAAKWGMRSLAMNLGAKVDSESSSSIIPSLQTAGLSNAAYLDLAMSETSSDIFSTQVTSSRPLPKNSLGATLTLISNSYSQTKTTPAVEQTDSSSSLGNELKNTLGIFLDMIRQMIDMKSAESSTTEKSESEGEKISPKATESGSSLPPIEFETPETVS